MIALRTPRRKDAMRESLTDGHRRAAHPLSTDRDPVRCSTASAMRVADRRHGSCATHTWPRRSSAFWHITARKRGRWYGSTARTRSSISSEFRHSIRCTCRHASMVKCRTRTDRAARSVPAQGKNGSGPRLAQVPPPVHPGRSVHSQMEPERSVEPGRRSGSGRRGTRGPAGGARRHARAHRGETL